MMYIHSFAREKMKLSQYSEPKFEYLEYNTIASHLANMS